MKERDIKITGIQRVAAVDDVELEYEYTIQELIPAVQWLVDYLSIHNIYFHGAGSS